MKLFEKLNYLAYRLRYEATYLEMKYHLKKVMKGKEDNYIKRIRHYDRNIGKSCALARLSVKYNIPVVVPFSSWTALYTRDIPRYIPKYFKDRLPQTIVANEYSRGKRFDYILIEECIPDDTMNGIIRPMVKKVWWDIEIWKSNQRNILYDNREVNNTKRFLHQKYNKYDLDYEEMYKAHMYLKEVVEKELNDEYLLVTTPTDLSVIDGDQIVITIDTKPYTGSELLEIIEKAAIYDDLCE